MATVQPALYWGNPHCQLHVAEPSGGVLEGPQQYIVQATAEGESVNHQAEELKVSPSAVCQRRDTIGRRARRFWGDEVLRDAQVLPLWRRQAERG